MNYKKIVINVYVKQACFKIKYKNKKKNKVLKEF